VYISIERRSGMRQQNTAILWGLVLSLVLPSCSINRMVMKKAADMMSGGGATGVFTADSDI
jgi:hypothetical protein